MNGTLLSNETRLGRLLRLPLQLIPRGAIVPILCGPLCGKKWIVGAGPHGYWLGVYERAKQQWLQRLLSRGDCFLDVGANVGFYTLLASRLVGSAGHVVAFEPSQRNLHFLRRHLRMNGIRNAAVYAAAVSDTAGVIPFAEGDNPSSGKLDPTGGLTVQAVTLDELWQEKRFPPPHVIKIDVEGEEAAVLRGGQTLLSQAWPVIVLSGHGWAKQLECSAFLTKLGYRLVVERDGAVDGMYESVAFPPADR